MKKKILITGASGFVGTNLINALKTDKRFLLFGTYFKNRPKYSKNVKYFKADLTKKRDCFRVLKILIMFLIAQQLQAGLLIFKKTINSFNTEYNY